MEFAWNYATLLAFFVGLAAGGLIGHYSTRDEEKKTAKAAFCRHCGKSLAD